MRGKTIAKIVVALAVVGVVYAAVKDDIAKLWQDLHVKIVEHPAPKKTVWLDQGIAKEKLSWFYHADQGTRTFSFPYEWFMALEQPTISWVPFTKVGPLQRHRLSRPLWLHRRIPSSRTRKRFRSGSRKAARCWIRRRAVAQPAHQAGHDRHRPDLCGLPHRQLHLQGHRRRHRRRTGAHQSLRDEAGHGHLAVADALLARPVRPLRRAHPGTGRDASRTARR